MERLMKEDRIKEFFKTFPYLTLILWYFDTEAEFGENLEVRVMQ